MDRARWEGVLDDERAGTARPASARGRRPASATLDEPDGVRARLVLSGRAIPRRSVIEWAVPHAAKVGAVPTADAAWSALASSDLGTARAAVEQLVDHPDAADTILKEKFAPPADAPAGKQAEGPEIPLSGELLRGVRAIEVLERIGTPAARTLLASWRDQTHHPRLATEAAFALNRLDALQ